jgi:3-deoxy-D-manno-oct-2-ulosonic acid (Kdo) hydroxylase
MNDVFEVPVRDWQPECSAATRAAAVDALERGGVLLFSQLRFALSPEELAVMTADVGGGDRKNVSFDPRVGALQGTGAGQREQAVLQDMMARFGKAARSLLHGVLPGYSDGLEQQRISLRPTEIEGRTTSWRKDDTRLHVDSFPSSPVHGQRILRVFSNINPHGKNRVWRIGEPFDDVAARFIPSVPPPRRGSAALMKALHITKSRRSPYDHYMLQLHDRMKADVDYQREVPQTVCEFQPGSSWICYTDQVSHAAMRGQFALEQTYSLPVASMAVPANSPLGILERELGRPLL